MFHPGYRVCIMNIALRVQFWPDVWVQRIHLFALPDSRHHHLIEQAPPSHSQWQVELLIWVLFVWFDSLHPNNNLSVIKERVFLGWTSTKLGLKCLAQGHNAVMPVRLEPAAPLSWVKHSTTKPLGSLSDFCGPLCFSVEFYDLLRAVALTKVWMH